MIREQKSEQPLFYSTQEIAQPAAGNFYRRLAAVVGDWRELAAPFAAAFCADFGRPTDPVVYLKIFLVGYLENIVYDTDLAERIADSLAIREFLGYSLSEETPAHDAISRNRARIGERCWIEDVLGPVVTLCQEAGLVSGQEAALDSSLIPANASLSSLRSVKTGKGVREHLREVRQRNRQAQEKVELQVSNEEFRSSTDPDARLAKKKGTPRDMCYRATQVTDAKAGIILAADCARADQGEVQAAVPVVAQAQGRLEATGASLGTLVADAGYDDCDFHAFVEELGATPLTNYQADGRKPEGFRKADFSYHPGSDCYLCPEGKRASYAGSSSGKRQYRTRVADCRDCLHRTQCIGGGKRRTVIRQAHEESRERNIARCHTEAGREALRRRGHIVEPAFGHMKTYGGLGLMNCRGLAKARVKVVMAAVAWNLRKLVGALARRAAEAGLSGQTSGLRAVVRLLWRILLALWSLAKSFSSKNAHPRPLPPAAA